MMGKCSAEGINSAACQAAPNSAAVTGDDQDGDYSWWSGHRHRGGTGRSHGGYPPPLAPPSMVLLICCNRPRCRSNSTSASWARRITSRVRLAGSSSRALSEGSLPGAGACQKRGAAGRSRPQRGWRPTAQALQTASSASWPPQG